MTSSPLLSDDAFLAGFLAASLPPSDFNHIGHVRAAWLLLQRFPLERAVTDTCEGIERLARRLGVPDKYNRTLSEALVRLMAQGGGADPGLSWEAFLSANPDLMQDARSLLARHYGDERLHSMDARIRFLPPDRLPLPA